ncbi:hypothetical protein POG22_02335 [Geitlerinema sp. CS-897]|nr:hypothetical protein [Geitlerinema sp. CS-897]
MGNWGNFTLTLSNLYTFVPRSPSLKIPSDPVRYLCIFTEIGATLSLTDDSNCRQRVPQTLPRLRFDLQNL